MPRYVRIKNTVRELIWYIVLVVVFIAIFSRVLLFINISVPESLTKFLSYNIIMFAVAMIMTFLWWRSSSTELEFLAPLRRLIQERCVWFAPTFIGVAFLLCTILFLQSNTIECRNPQSPPLHLTCIFVIPQLYGMLMYLFPPKHISKVIAPGWGILSMIIRFVLAIAFGACAYVQFAANFL